MNNRRSMLREHSKVGMVKCLSFAFTVVLINEASAQATLQPVQTMLQTIIAVLTGQIASLLAIIAVISCGFLAWTGRFTWGIAGSVILGIVLVFGSAQIVTFFQTALGQ